MTAGHRGRLAPRLLAVAFSAIAALSLLTFLLITDIRLVARDITVYRASFATSGATARTGLDVDQLTRVITRVIDYSMGRRPDLQLDRAELDGGPPGRPALTQREVRHMVDVRALFARAETWRWGSLVLSGLGAGVVFLLLSRRGALLALSVAAAVVSSAVLLGLAAIGALALTAFDPFWDFFHELAFTNDLWLLPRGSLLIEMLPLSLFQSLVLRVAGLFALEAVLLLVTGLVIGRRVRGLPGEPA